MTNSQILKKAIEKAGGKMEITGWSRIVKIGKKEFEHSELYWQQDFTNNEYYSIIFSHDFAKAFWGEEWISKKVMEHRPTPEGTNYITDIHTPTWQYHLQMAVKEKEPLKYIEKFL